MGPRDVLIQVQATQTCGTDVKKYRRGYPLQMPPYMLGHETSGAETIRQGAVKAGRRVRLQYSVPLVFDDATRESAHTHSLSPG